MSATRNRVLFNLFSKDALVEYGADDSKCQSCLVTIEEVEVREVVF